MTVRNRIKELRYVRAGDLAPNEWNYRIHSSGQRRALEALLKEIGYADALLAYQKDGRLVLCDGHLRASLDPEQTVPVLVLDVTEEEAKKLLASLDPLAAMAGQDDDKLRELLKTLETGDNVLKDLWAGLVKPVPGSGLTDPDAVPEPPEDPVTRRGDLWILGDHRLLCADAGSAEDVDRLLDGAPVHLVCTDPPFNVRVEPRSNNAIAKAAHEGRVLGRNVRASVATRKRGSSLKNSQLDLARHPTKARPTGRMRPKDRPLENDWIPDEEFEAKLALWFGNIARVLREGRSYYVWGGYSNIFNYPKAIRTADLYFSQLLVWVKGHAVLTRRDYMGDFEQCWYGWKPGAAHYFNPGVTSTDVWAVKKVNPQEMVHLTEKPVELFARAIENSSRRGENVLDLFAGSGSTCIAAEQTGRKSFLMEIDPLYCDVICERFRGFSGKEPVHAASGRPLSEMKREKGTGDG
ncbi:MAG TPA: DNA methyltransferase [Planctomycetota bacterium]|nr:DNA methyltransferase [Planctomycetota bacterium]